MVVPATSQSLPPWLSPSVVPSLLREMYGIGEGETQGGKDLEQFRIMTQEEFTLVTTYKKTGMVLTHHLDQSYLKKNSQN